ILAAVAARALWLLAALTSALLAAPAFPVALNVSGLPVSPVAVAVSVFAPAVVPSVQLPTVAIPSLPVLGVAVVMLPPPEATAKEIGRASCRVRVSIVTVPVGLRVT